MFEIPRFFQYFVWFSPTGKCLPIFSGFQSEWEPWFTTTNPLETANTHTMDPAGISYSIYRDVVKRQVYSLILKNFKISCVGSKFPALPYVVTTQYKGFLYKPCTSCCSMSWKGGNNPCSKLVTASGFTLHVVRIEMHIDSNK